MAASTESPFPAPELRVSLLREQVTDLLRQAVVDQKLKPGQRLIERELVEWTGVSRATIREAIRELAAEGLVTTVPQQGAVVAVPSAKEAAELYEVRALLEGYAARQFLKNATPEQVSALRRSVESIKEAAAEGAGIRGILTAKRTFYEVLFEGADSPTVHSLLRALQARITVLRTASLSQPQRLEAMLNEIEAILEAIEAGDVEGVERASVEHVRAAGREAIAALRGVSGTATP